MKNLGDDPNDSVSDTALDEAQDELNGHLVKLEDQLMAIEMKLVDQQIDATTEFSGIVQNIITTMKNEITTYITDITEIDGIFNEELKEHANKESEEAQKRSEEDENLYQKWIEDHFELANLVDDKETLNQILESFKDN